jgi:hypothetical protein
VVAVNETLGLRMLAAAVLTLLASLAASWGALERVLAVFPLLAVVMAVATQRARHGCSTGIAARHVAGAAGLCRFLSGAGALLPRLEGNLAFAGSLISIGLQLLSRRLLPA